MCTKGILKSTNPNLNGTFSRSCWRWLQGSNCTLLMFTDTSEYLLTIQNKSNARIVFHHIFIDLEMCVWWPWCLTQKSAQGWPEVLVGHLHCYGCYSFLTNWFLRTENITQLSSYQRRLPFQTISGNLLVVWCSISVPDIVQNVISDCNISVILRHFLPYKTYFKGHDITQNAINISVLVVKQWKISAFLLLTAKLGSSLTYKILLCQHAICIGQSTKPW